MDGDNWYNSVAKAINRHLKVMVGPRWREHVRGGKSVHLATLSTRSNPFTDVLPEHFDEWRSRGGQVRTCVHPTALTFGRYYVQPLVNLLRSLD